MYDHPTTYQLHLFLKYRCFAIQQMNTEILFTKTSLFCFLQYTIGYINVDIDKEINIRIISPVIHNLQLKILFSTMFSDKTRGIIFRFWKLSKDSFIMEFSRASSTKYGTIYFFISSSEISRCPPVTVTNFTFPASSNVLNPIQSSIYNRVYTYINIVSISQKN